jgi:matrixin
MGPLHARALGGVLRAALFAGLATGLALLGSGVACANDAKTFLGFRLLDLENQSVKWQTATFGQSAVVTYAFATAPVSTPGARNCAAMLPPAHAYEPSQVSDRQFRREVAAAFRMWEKVANITFREASSATSAEILIGAQAVPVGRAFTNVALKEGTGDKKVIARSLICLNPKQPWKIGFDGRLGVYDLRYTIAHEIGHAIGLDHPGAAGQLMSYRYDEKQPGLQPGDVKGAVLLYGARPGSQRFATRASGSAAEAPPANGESGWPFGIGVNSKRASPKALPAP